MENHRFDVHSKKPMIQCTSCDYNTRRRAVMAAHVKRVHLKEKNYSCETCGRLYYDIGSLNEHMLRHRVVKEYVFSDPTLTTVKEEVQDEIDLNYGTTRFPDDLIGEYTVLETEFTRQCKRCEKKIKTHKQFRAHFDRVHQCKKCKQRYDTYDDRVKHMKKCHEEPSDGAQQNDDEEKGPYRCNVCSKMFELRHQLSNHLRRIHPPGGIRCEPCDLTFPRHVDLINHRYDEHLKKPKNKCNMCNYETRRQSCLKAHTDRVHLKVLAVTCQVCGLQFYCETNLRAHMLSENVTIKSGICDSCIQKLRECLGFKQQVLKSEKAFLKMLIDEEKKYKIDVKVKQEVIDLDNDMDNMYLDLKEEYNDDDEDDKNLALLAIEQFNLKNKFNKDVVVKKVAKKTKSENQKSQKPLKLVSIKPSLLTASFATEMRKHFHNTENLIKYSNALPFSNKTLQGYICAYCKNTQPDLHSLRLHTSAEHAKHKIDYHQRHSNDLGIKMEISDLKCNVCEEKFDVIANLKAHLAKKHNVAFHMDVKDYVLEFKLKDNERLDCALCNSTFETFKMLLQHMNGHYRNYICDVCDLGFINQLRLKNHVRIHETGSFKCSFCEKVFTTKLKLRCHEKFVHEKNTRRYNTKCPQCDETFANYYQRNRHMLTEHNKNAANYNCNICERVFLMKSKLTSHIKKVHLMERNHVCNECGHTFFWKRCLEEHMVKHKGERIYQCNVCTKAYARKKTLREHMRIHSNDRRFKCGVCGCAFVQKCSLKSHMLSNHGLALAEFENGVRIDNGHNSIVVQQDVM
ncbi:unnamed protein product [Plutella xylostella]|uniref:(diamondback moth) hypothetical protein n=1 Tax=Plutella xylostella TaxID=51655 RepID=A0A8S4DX68_PLUXY|nr:unnamed protein product [Plutella xylostella]